MELEDEKIDQLPPLFLKALNSIEIWLLKRHIVSKTYKKGSIIFEEDTASGGIFYIKKGKVKIYKYTALGENITIFTYGKGDYFGYAPLFSDSLQPVSARATDDLTVYFIKKDVFTKLLIGSNKLMQAILADLSRDCEKLVRGNINKIPLLSIASKS